jgi:nucleotide-binding universal stress UspA family protein
MTDSMRAVPNSTSAARPRGAGMLRRVLVAVDGSPTADAALLQALELQRGFGSDLILCTVVDKDSAIAAASAADGAFLGFDAVLAHYNEAASALLSQAALRASATGARVTTTLLEGRPANTIAEYAAECGVDAIVLGTRGKRGFERMFLGSTAEGVLRLTSVPTFVVHVPHETSVGDAAPPPARTLARILVALDDSDSSDAAVAFACDLAATAGSTLVFAHAVDGGDLFARAESFGYNPAPLFVEMRASAAELLAARAQAAKARGLAVETLVVEGGAAEAIVDAAAVHDADLIVVGTHGRRGLQRLVMGSVAEHIVRRSAVPVAVLRGVPVPATI